ncbi:MULTISPECIES: hypothetical protein [unclassified Sedimentibacter]|uniref:hypothetical protein n=1 Tax=unclassified Sedimentibacter TaxID=2649220 RepID=UPI0027DEB7B0|nr:hypothetical protein [Sedimentibacter sp. MB35-C1]WMJ76004.1 hypothetical protein RBQ61_10210 [Sedimentibacter sp. MB35-C1]
MINVIVENVLKKTSETSPLVLIVANSYSKIVEESAIYREGESSNGTFRGNGLYLIKQIEKNNPNITIDTTITEELFIQEANINNLSEKEKTYDM